MLKQEIPTSLGNKKIIEGIHVVSLDSKNRFAIWAEWKEYFPEWSEIKLLYVWNYAIVVNKWIFDNFTLNPELIIHTVQVDKNNRILLPKNFLTTYGIDPEDYVYVIGKWNHIELYFQKEKFEETKNRAIQAATQFQVNLVLNKEL